MVGVFLLFPSLAHAHTAGASFNGWQDGFNHPLHGWDNLLAMLAVGIWAAQQRGRSVWLLPLTFICVMSAGGLFGITGIRLPGVELGILLSVLALFTLVVRRISARFIWALPVIGLFGFLHGFAHGREMPGSATILAFGIGFILATLLLHALGLLAARGVIIALACSVGNPALAQETTNATQSHAGVEPREQEPVRLPPVVVTGRSDSLVGIADSAT